AKLRAELVADLETRQRREAHPLYEPARWQGPTVTKAARSNGGGNGLSYATRDDALVAPAAAGDTPSGIDPILFEGISEALALLRADVRHELDRRIATLQNENSELRGILGSVLTLLGEKLPAAKAAAGASRARKRA